MKETTPTSISALRTDFYRLFLSKTPSKFHASFKGHFFIKRQVLRFFFDALGWDYSVWLVTIRILIRRWVMHKFISIIIVDSNCVVFRSSFLYTDLIAQPLILSSDFFKVEGLVLKLFLNQGHFVLVDLTVRVLIGAVIFIRSADLAESGISLHAATLGGSLWLVEVLNHYTIGWELWFLLLGHWLCGKVLAAGVFSLVPKDKEISIQILSLRLVAWKLVFEVGCLLGERLEVLVQFLDETVFLVLKAHRFSWVFFAGGAGRPCRGPFCKTHLNFG